MDDPTKHPSWTLLELDVGGIVGGAAGLGNGTARRIVGLGIGGLVKWAVGDVVGFPGLILPATLEPATHSSIKSSISSKSAKPPSQLTTTIISHHPHPPPILWGLTLSITSDVLDMCMEPGDVSAVPFGARLGKRYRGDVGCGGKAPWEVPVMRKPMYASHATPSTDSTTSNGTDAESIEAAEAMSAEDTEGSVEAEGSGNRGSTPPDSTARPYPDVLGMAVVAAASTRVALAAVGLGLVGKTLARGRFCDQLRKDGFDAADAEHVQRETPDGKIVHSRQGQPPAAQSSFASFAGGRSRDSRKARGESAHGNNFFRSGRQGDSAYSISASPQSERYNSPTEPSSSYVPATFGEIPSPRSPASPASTHSYPDSTRSFSSFSRGGWMQRSTATSSPTSTSTSTVLDLPWQHESVPAVPSPSSPSVPASPSRTDRNDRNNHLRKASTATNATAVTTANDKEEEEDRGRGQKRKTKKPGVKRSRSIFSLFSKKGSDDEQEENDNGEDLNNDRAEERHKWGSRGRAKSAPRNPVSVPAEEEQELHPRRLDSAFGTLTNLSDSPKANSPAIPITVVPGDYDPPIPPRRSFGAALRDQVLRPDGSSTSQSSPAPVPPPRSEGSRSRTMSTHAHSYTTGYNDAKEAGSPRTDSNSTSMSYTSVLPVKADYSQEFSPKSDTSSTLYFPSPTEMSSDKHFDTRNPTPRNSDYCNSTSSGSGSAGTKTPPPSHTTKRGMSPTFEDIVDAFEMEAALIAGRRTKSSVKPVAAPEQRSGPSMAVLLSPHSAPASPNITSKSAHRYSPINYTTETELTPPVSMATASAGPAVPPPVELAISRLKIPEVKELVRRVSARRTKASANASSAAEKQSMDAMLTSLYEDVSTTPMQVHRCRFVDYVPAAISALAFTPKTARPHLACARANGDIEIWGVVGNWVLEKTIPGGLNQSVECVAWVHNLPDDSDSDSETMEDDGGPSQSGRAAKKKPTYLPSHSKIPPRLFSSGLNAVVTEYSLTSLRPVATVACPGGAVWCMAVNPRSSLLVVGCDDGTPRLLDVSEGDFRLIKALDRGAGRILSIAWSSDGTQVWAGHSDGCIRRWNVATGRIISRITLDSRRGRNNDTLVWALTVLADNTVVAGDSLGTVTFFDSRTETVLRRFPKAHFTDVLCIAASEAGDVVYTGGVDRKIAQFRLTDIGGGDGTRSKSTESALQATSSRWVLSGDRRYHSHDIRSLALWESHPIDALVSGGVDTQMIVAQAKLFPMGNPKRMSSLPTKSAIEVCRLKRWVAWRHDRGLKVWKLGEGEPVL
ncbi:U3 small nucleolar RNA-associated protein [Gonapodya sp. JEL0774]|nr:U3 small nucleolar RNA-associated protein [Gonapodya sp. JEL0774]